MTVAAKSSSIEYLENGTTLAFAVPFRFLSGAIKADRVLADGTVIALSAGTHFSVSGGATDAGGTLTLVSSVAGARLRLRRETAREQAADYIQADAFPAESHEGALDRAMMIDQEQDVKIADTALRALLVPDGESAPPLPSLDTIKGKYLAIDADGLIVGGAGTTDDDGLRVDLANGDGGLVGLDDGAGGANWASVKTFIAYLLAATGAGITGFQPAGLTASSRTVQDKLREEATLADFGAIGDGALHTVAEWIIPGAHGRYASLAAVQVDYPHVAATTDCLNWAAIQKAHDWAVANGRRRVTGQGRIKFAKTVAMSGFGITLEGPRGGRAVGNETVDLELVWGGGNFPMFTATATRYRFADFLIVNEGLGKSFLELNTGAQGFEFDQVHCQSAGHTPFTEALVKSNGNELGDSVVRDCLINAVAPKLFFVDGMGTANSITGIRFEGENVFIADVANLRVLYIKDESYETVSFTGKQRFLQKNGYECCAIDNTDTVGSHMIRSLVMEGCEFEAAGADTSTYRFFRLANVLGFTFSMNVADGGGTKTHLGTLTNCHVQQCDGNYYNGIATALFEIDALSTIRHGKQGFSQRPVFTVATGGVIKPAFGASIQIDGRMMSQQKTELVVVEISSNIGFTVTIDTSSPQWMSPGQCFILRLANVSAGAVAAGTLGANLRQPGGGASFPAAAAAGNHRDYFVSWDGTIASVTAMGSADVASA